jgi:hypothetical protein
MDWFADYLEKFERDVVIRGISRGDLGKTELVPVRIGKLAKTRFGKLVGAKSDSWQAFAIDYYGLLKPSLGFEKSVAEKAEQLGNRQLKKMEVVVVHFAAIRIEDVAKIGEDEAITAGFPRFKERILKERGFKRCQS